MSNTFGGAVRLTIFGESHGPAIGGVLDGIAAGCEIDEGYVAFQMEKRRAKKDGLSTARAEADAVRFLGGVRNGRAAGGPIAFVIENTDARSSDYAKTAGLARPGHADWPAHVKYAGFEDWRGGGHFSGRVTAALVAAGAVCQHILAQRGVAIATHIAQAAGIDDEPFAGDGADLAAQLAALEANTGFPALCAGAAEKMQAAIRAAAAEGDSVPVGLGEPFFDSVEGVLAHLLFSIPAVKGVEFGAGFGFARLKGSEANDPLTVRGGRVRLASNRSGGANGGLTNGMPLVFRCCVRPTPSIYKPQQTVDLATGQEAELRLSGRHDPCILHRAAIVQTAAAALGLLDLWTRAADENAQAGR